MDVMEPMSIPDLCQEGLSNNNFMDETGLQDCSNDNRDSLLDLLSQSFPDMLLQPYGHLSSLPLDAPDLQLCIQEEDCQDSDSAEDSILQEFVSEVQNILTDRKRTNVTNTPDLNESFSLVPSLIPNCENTGSSFTPIRKLWPDQLDLLTGPLLDGEDEDLAQVQKSQLLVPDHSIPQHSSPLSECKAGTSSQEIISEIANEFEKSLKYVAVVNGKSNVACVKPVMRNLQCSKPMVSIVKTVVPAVTSVKPIVKIVKVEEESSDEIDIETVDDDDGRSGSEVLSAQLADLQCQAARVRILPKKQSKVKDEPINSANTTISPAPPDAAHTNTVSSNIFAKTTLDTAFSNVPAKTLQIAASSTTLLAKPASKPKEKETSPALLVEKIKQSVVAPRSSILIPPVLPQPKVKCSKQEANKLGKVTFDCSNVYDARTFDHDYCNMEAVDSSFPILVVPVKEEPVSVEVNSSDLCVVEESLVTIEMEVLNITEEIQIQPDSILNPASFSSTVPNDDSLEPVVMKKCQLPLSYSKWHRSPSPTYSQSSALKARTRRRSSCSPSSVSSQSIYRSRSRSSSRGRKGRSQTHHRRKRSACQSSRHSHRNSKRNRYNYSRSSSRSSYSSRSCSPSSSRSRSRSRCRSRSRSWDYKRVYNRAPIKSYNRDKRPFQEDQAQQIEERRVVYVGRLPDGTTKNDLRHRFGCFGPIQEVSVHFRDTGHNYGFVTFTYKSDAYEAVEHGNDDPHQPKFDLSFGGRRQFCKQRYADLDSQYNNMYSISRPAPTNDFDSLLRAATKQTLKKY